MAVDISVDVLREDGPSADVTSRFQAVLNNCSPIRVLNKINNLTVSGLAP
jgi:hypothetical protein